jgi:hypothetical protein
MVTCQGSVPIPAARPSAPRGTVDWIAVWDATTGTPYYAPASVFDGHSQLTLCLTPARNRQNRKIRHAADFLEI